MKYPLKLFLPILLLLAWTTAWAGQAEEVITDLDAVLAEGGSPSRSRLLSISEKIAQTPQEVLPLLLEKGSSPDLSEDGLAIVLWALGQTDSPEAVAHIIRLAEAKNTDKVLKNGYQALADIGNDDATQYLFRSLLSSSQPRMRSFLIDLLAGLRYTVALPAALEILELDPNNHNRPSIFVFGKYGELAVPFLLDKISHPNANVRANSIMVLGQWLIAAEAVEPLKKQFWREQDTNIQILILSSLEKLLTRVEELKAFAKETIVRKKDEEVVDFAIETVGNADEMVTHINAFRSFKKDDRPLFEQTYSELYGSQGRLGDYNDLAATSTRADENRLRELQRVVLQRNSNECLRDYQKINDVILLNKRI